MPYHVIDHPSTSYENSTNSTYRLTSPPQGHICIETKKKVDKGNSVKNVVVKTKNGGCNLTVDVKERSKDIRGFKSNIATLLKVNLLTGVKVSHYALKNINMNLCINKLPVFSMLTIMNGVPTEDSM